MWTLFECGVATAECGMGNLTPRRKALVAANRELITRFEQKIQTTLARIWGEEPSVTAVQSPALAGLTVRTSNPA